MRGGNGERERTNLSFTPGELNFTKRKRLNLDFSHFFLILIYDPMVVKIGLII